ncbi:MAG: DNA polymerase III subunit gamma/tau [Terrimicrobiaceae bacterium]
MWVYSFGVSYRVFARKYRPQTFEEVLGQDHITRTLQNAVSSGRVAQAYLFVGPRGIGKTSTARLLAKALNCAQGPTATPCGKCDACKEIAEGRSLDVLEIDGASNNGVDNIRELRDNAAYAPARGPFKIYLIDEVHMLSPGAFNALLKTLEEPPEHVKFILATTEAQKVPATITSRCQRFDLRRIPAKAIAEHLMAIAEKEHIQLETEAAEDIARGSEGSLRDAESMLDQAVAFCGEKVGANDVRAVFGFTSREAVAELAGCVLRRDAAGGLEIIAEQAEAGKDMSRLLNDLVGHLRDLLVAGVAAVESSPPRDKLLVLFDNFAEAESRMRWTSDKKLQLDVAVIKATHLLGQASLDEVIETLTSLQSGAPHSPRAAQPARIEPPPGVHAKPGTPADSKSSETASIDAALAWNRVASSYESSIKYRWLTKAVFAGASQESVLVQLAPSFAGELRSVVGEAGRKDAEDKLREALGRKVSLRLEIGEQLVEPPQADADAQSATSPDRADVPREEKPSDPVEAFKNDPLIKKALEIFAGEIQTANK